MKKTEVTSRNIPGVMLLRGAGVIAGFSMNVFITRFADMSGAGIFFAALALVMLWGLMGTVGLCDGILRLYPSVLVLKGRMHARVLGILGGVGVLMSGLLVACGVMAVLLYTAAFSRSFAFFLCACIPLVSFIQYCGYLCQSMNRSCLSVLLISLSWPVLFTISNLISVMFDTTLSADVLIRNLFFAVFLTSVAILLMAWRGTFFEIENRFRWYAGELELSGVGRLLSSFLLILICNSLLQWMTPVMTGLWGNAEDVALISVCQRTGQIMIFFLVSLNVVFAPVFSTLNIQGKTQELKTRVRVAARLTFLLSLPVFAVLMVFPEIILSLFGPEYVRGQTALRIIIGGQFINMITGPVAFLLTMTGHERIFRNIIMFSTILLLTGLSILGLFWGVTGIAVAVALSLICQNVLSAFFVFRELHINILDFFYRK